MNATEKFVRSQLHAMQAELYEIGLFRPERGAANGEVRNATMILRIWDRESLIKSIGWLRYQNLQGANVFIRPKGPHHLSLIDDLSPAAVERMKTSGYQPAVIIETSPGNCQVWLNHGRSVETDVSTVAARHLAKQFEGDVHAADWRHFGRLAGFTNRKLKHRQENGFYPWVRVIEAEDVVYDRAQEVLAAAEREVARRRERAAEEAARWGSRVTRAPVTKSIEDFWNDPRYNGPHHQADLAYAKYALARGLSEKQIGTDISRRDLKGKGSPKRIADYIQRTIAKARAGLAQNLALER